MRWKSACPFPSGKDWAWPKTATDKQAIDPKLKMDFPLYFRVIPGRPIVSNRLFPSQPSGSRPPAEQLSNPSPERRLNTMQLRLFSSVMN
jgi:hypothetical protein